MFYCINPWCPGGERRLNLEHESSCKYCGTDLLINNRYHLLEPLRPLSGDDNYQIFKVIDSKNNEQSVLKTQIVSGEKVNQLFNREIELLLNLDDPAVPKGKDSFSVMILNPERRELRCLVMEHINGENLEQWIRNYGKIGSDLSPKEAKVKALDWLYQLTNILSFIHQRDVIHRDIKPSNIMLRSNSTKGKELALIDFGIAKRSSSNANQVALTTPVGSPGYTPPEVQNGKSVAQSDFFALGGTFVYLLTKKHPRDYENNLQAWKKDTVFPSSRLIKLINDLMSERPENRPHSTTEILQRIEEIRAKELQPPLRSYYLYLRDILPVIRKFVVVGLAAYGLYSLLVPNSPNSTNSDNSNASPVSNTSPSSTPRTNLQPAKELISAGEKSLYKKSRPLRGNYAQLKDDGIKAFLDGDYTTAEKKFTRFLDDAKEYKISRARTDPEILIFRNNAEVRKRHKKGEPIYTIAVAIPITNRNKFRNDKWFPQGQQILFGVAQAQSYAIDKEKDININLEVVIVNDRNYGEQAVSIAKELTKTKFQNRSILAVIGHYTSDVTCKALKEYAKADKNLVVISPGSSETDLRKEECGHHKAFFRTTSSTKIEAESFVKHILKLKEDNEIPKPKIAVFYNKKERFSKDLFSQFQSRLKVDRIEISKDFQIDLTKKDFDADDELKHLVDSRVNIVALFPDGSTDTNIAYGNALNLLKQPETMIAEIKKIFGSNPLLQQKTITDGRNKKLSDQLILAVDWDTECGSPNFLKDARDQWGGDVNRLTSLSYEATQVLFTALKRLSSQTVSRETLHREIQNRSRARVESHVFKKDKTISFDENTGSRIEIKERMLVTPNRNDSKYELLDGSSCSANK